MTGAGILALAHAGLHDTPEAQQAGKSLLEFSFTEYNMPKPGLDRRTLSFLYFLDTKGRFVVEATL